MPRRSTSSPCAPPAQENSSRPAASTSTATAVVGAVGCVRRRFVRHTLPKPVADARCHPRDHPPPSIARSASIPSRCSAIPTLQVIPPQLGSIGSIATVRSVPTAVPRSTGRHGRSTTQEPHTITFIIDDLPWIIWHRIPNVPRAPHPRQPRNVPSHRRVLSPCLRLENTSKAKNSAIDVEWLDIGRGQQLHIIGVGDFEVSAFEREYGRHIAFFASAAELPGLKGTLAERGVARIARRTPDPIERFFFNDPEWLLDRGDRRGRLGRIAWS